VLSGLPEEHELDEREEVLLRLAGAQADDLQLLEQLVKVEGASSTGSQGQRVVHPAVQEARQARLSIARLLSQLDLTESGSGGSDAQIRGRRAAQARWAKHGTRGSGE
jgi:hypothetical protein